MTYWDDLIYEYEMPVIRQNYMELKSHFIMHLYNCNENYTDKEFKSLPEMSLNVSIGNFLKERRIE